MKFRKRSIFKIIIYLEKKAYVRYNPRIMVIPVNWNYGVDHGRELILGNFLTYRDSPCSAHLPALSLGERMNEAYRYFNEDPDAFADDTSIANPIIRHVGRITTPFPGRAWAIDENGDDHCILGLSPEDYGKLFAPLIPNSPLARVADKRNGFPLLLRLAALVVTAVELPLRYLVTWILEKGISLCIKETDEAAYLTFRASWNQHLPFQLLVSAFNH